MPPPPPPKRPSGTALGGEPGPGSSSKGAPAADDTPCPPGIDIRPVPLKPRTSSKLRVLCATSAGALWAGPSLRGGVLRYPDVSTASHLGAPLTSVAGLDGVLDPSSAALLAAPPPGVTADVVAPAAQGEDADAEPCGEFTGPPSVAASNAACVSSGGVTCMCFEPARDIVWTGHSDGRVCSWRAGVAPRGQPPGLGGGCVASWQAHKGPMACVLLTRDGSLWSGGKGGTLRVWHPGITLAGPATSMAPTSAAAALAGALSGPSLAEGAKTLTRRDGNKPHLELRGLAGCMHGARELVWSAGATSFVVWCAKTYVALRVITPDGSPVPDIPPEEAAEQQRAREAASGGGGAASLFGRLSKAVERRVARANEYLDGADVGTSAGGPRILALASAPWGGLIASLEVQAQSGGGGVGPAGSSSGNLAGGASGSAHGGGLAVDAGPTYLVQRYASDGSPADSATAVGAPVRTLVAAQPPAGVHGPLLLWVGLASGTVLVLEAEAAGGAGSHVTVRATWAAHKGSLVSCAPLPGRMLTLGDDGAIRAWPWNGAMASPGVGAALDKLVGAISTSVQLRIFTGTWNVAEKRPDPRSLRAWLGDRVDGCDLVALGLQEIEKLNASSVGASAAKELVGLGDVLNANATWWQTSMLAVLEEATATSGGGPWDFLAGRQLSGALVLVYVRRRLGSALGAPLTASAACGIMGVGGNKGGVGVRVALHRKALVFVNCHLAAHQNAVLKRNNDVATIFTNLMFEPQLAEFWRQQQQRASGGQEKAPAGTSAAAAAANDDDSGDDAPNTDDLPSAAAADAKAAAASAKKVALPRAGGLGDADLLLFFGDTNYRLDLTYDDATAAAARGDTAWLAKHDQCSKERSAGRLFQEPRLQEGPLGFLPTYKFDKGTQVYDTSEKRRIPAWCDRVLWADSPGKGGVAAELLAYESIMDVCDSDHKPVRQLMKVTLHTCDEPRKRRAVVAALHMQAAGGGGSVQVPAVVQPLVQDLLSL